MRVHNTITENWDWADDIFDRFLADTKRVGLRFTGVERQENPDGTTRLLVHGWVNVPNLLKKMPAVVAPLSVIHHFLSVGGEIYADFFPHYNGSGVRLSVEHTNYAGLVDASVPIIAASLDDWCDELRDDIDTLAVKLRDIINGYVGKLADSLDDELAYLEANEVQNADSRG